MMRAPLLSALPLLLVLVVQQLVVASVDAFAAKAYTANYVCLENNCVNPIFPAFRILEQDILEKQEARKWRCVKDLPGVAAGKSSARYSEFCGSLLNYPFAVPDEKDKEETVETRMRRENQKALEAYVSQVDGLGLEVLENRQPWNAGTPECVQSVWKMVCWTYFPKCAPNLANAVATAAQMEEAPSDAASAEAAPSSEAAAQSDAEVAAADAAVEPVPADVAAQVAAPPGAAPPAEAAPTEAAPAEAAPAEAAPAEAAAADAAAVQTAEAETPPTLIGLRSLTRRAHAASVTKHSSRMNVVAKESVHSRLGLSSEHTPYLRPCRSGCSNYVRKCEIQCCDESVQCVFEHKSLLSDGKVLTKKGYIDHAAPSLLCTGNAFGRFASSRGLLVLVFCVSLLFLGLGDLDVEDVQGLFSLPTVNAATVQRAKTGMTVEKGAPRIDGIHKTAYWRKKKDFTMSGQGVLDPETGERFLGSCNNPHVKQSDKCNGKGVCIPWDKDGGFRICKCDLYQAGAECQVTRKSQTTAYFLSLFLGFLGVDRFYMENWFRGLMKLLTLGGFGTAWVYDVVLIGSGDVYAGEYRLAPDISTGIAQVVTPFTFLLIGLFFAVCSTQRHIMHKRRKHNEELGCREAAPLTGY